MTLMIKHIVKKLNNKFYLKINKENIFIDIRYQLYRKETKRAMVIL